MPWYSLVFLWPGVGFFGGNDILNNLPRDHLWAFLLSFLFHVFMILMAVTIWCGYLPGVKEEKPNLQPSHLLYFHVNSSPAPPLLPPSLHSSPPVSKTSRTASQIPLSASSMPISDRSPIDEKQGSESGDFSLISDHPEPLSSPAPAYPENARRRKQEGLVLVLVFVDSSGSTSRVELKKTSGFSSLDEEAIKTLYHWTFKPVYKGSKPVSFRATIPIRFHLSK